MPHKKRRSFCALLILFCSFGPTMALPAFAQDAPVAETVQGGEAVVTTETPSTTEKSGISLGPIRVEFILFALTLLGIALFHQFAFQFAVGGAASVLLLKLGFTDFALLTHIHHEWAILVNLLGLLLGFAILAKYFEDSGVPHALPNYLPDGWLGAFTLLWITFVLSSFLDNIAAAMIGGTIALSVFKKKVHIGYLAAIVAASNAGGSGSVVGDTTTTMMWIDGVAAVDVLSAYVAAIPATLLFAAVAAKQQNSYQPITKEVSAVHIDWTKLGIVGLILVGAILANVYLDFPAAGVWGAIFIGTFIRKAPWGEAKNALKGSVFLLSLVLSASMMPVDQLPAASWQTAFVLGFVSSVFDNIPLTKLALTQGGYDWGMLAYAVGFGGSMIWFGSSAGVAISNMFHEAKSVGRWLANGWHVSVAYVIGFFIMFALLGWNPHAPHKEGKDSEQHSEQPQAEH